MLVRRGVRRVGRPGVLATADDAQPAPPPSDDGLAELQQLAQMHTQGLLTDDEFAAAKAKLLGL